MAEVTTNYTVALILTLIAILALGGCAYKIYRPNCDSLANDMFNDFVNDFEACSKNSANCKSFDHSDFPVGHQIFLVSEDGITDVGLRCNGVERKSKFFDNIGICSSENGAYRGVLSEFTIDTETEDYSLNGNLKLEKIREREVCFARVFEEVYPSEVLS
jgi:hypothetical protein